MAGDKAELNIESLRLYPRTVRSQLNQPTISVTSPLNDPLHQPRPDSLIADIFAHTDSLYLSPPRAAVAQAGNKCELQSRHYFASQCRHNEFVVRMSFYLIESPQLLFHISALWRRTGHRIALKHFKNGGKILAVGRSDFKRVAHPPIVYMGR